MAQKMMKERDWFRRSTIAWVVFTALLPGAALAAPAAPAVAPSEKEVAVRATQLSAAEKAGRSASDAATKAQERIATLNEARKKATLERDAGRKELSQRLKAAKAADQKFQASIKKPGHAPAFEALDVARQEYAAAQAAGTGLKKAAAQLGSTEAELAASAERAEASARQAQTSADEAKAAAEELQRVASVAKQTASVAKATAAKARAQSGFPSAAAFASSKARADAESAKLDASLTEAGKQLSTLNAFKQASQVVVMDCDTNDVKGSWKPPEAILAAAIRQTQGGMCSALCLYGAPLAEAAVKCAASRKTTLISLTAKRNAVCTIEHPQDSCGLLTRGLEMGSRHFIAISTAPGGDYILDVLEVKGDKVVPYYSGAPYVDVACHPELTGPGNASGMTAAMRAEWKPPPPALRIFICGG